MNVDIIDRAAFESLNPADVAAYLSSNGWNQLADKPGYCSIWLGKTKQGEEAELLLPLDRSIGDYRLRMKEAVKLIAAVESRTELEMLSDLQTIGSDVIRVRYRHGHAGDGTIPLERGEALVENALGMMLAGACAAVSRRSYFGNLKPQQAREFVQKLRMGQSERGSYVLTVLSPVPPKLRPTQLSFVPDESDQPFERRAVCQVHAALAALRIAADAAMSSFQMASFEKAVQDGVSANLCSAVVGMNGHDSHPSNELRISFTYAQTRPATGVPAREIVFSGDRFPLIAEAARMFRQSAPPEETEIRGVVVQLRRDEQSGPVSGPVTIVAFIEGKPRRVQIALDEAHHMIAVQAYQQGAQICCRGDLVKVGKGWELQNPKGFSILIEE